MEILLAVSTIIGGIAAIGYFFDKYKKTDRQHDQKDLVPNIYEQEYPIARALLIKEGWIPKIRHWSHGSTVDVHSSNGSYYWNKGYHELVYCSGTGYALCRFEFQDPEGNLLVVITSGEATVDDKLEIQAKVFRVLLNPENEQGAYGDTLGAARE